MAYKIKKPITNKERADFIFEYNRDKGLRIAETEDFLYALEENEKIGEKKVKGVAVRCPIINPNYEEEKAAEDKKILETISITRSEFFNGMILAFGLGEDEIIPILEQLAEKKKIGDIKKKLLLNVVKNESVFYRKYEMFSLLSDTPIQISKKQTVEIKSEQWDNFFKRLNVCDEDAYKELLPKEE